MGFNRTFMELKSFKDAAVFWTLWSFNRTFMELKYKILACAFVVGGFNRTFMELKFVRYDFQSNYYGF